jgi:hypothetical protein
MADPCPHEFRQRAQGVTRGRGMRPRASPPGRARDGPNADAACHKPGDQPEPAQTTLFAPNQHRGWPRPRRTTRGCRTCGKLNHDVCAIVARSIGCSGFFQGYMAAERAIVEREGKGFFARYSSPLSDVVPHVLFKNVVELRSKSWISSSSERAVMLYERPSVFQ